MKVIEWKLSICVFQTFLLLVIPHLVASSAIPLPI